MRIFVFGSSITSSYWNGAATYYRGIYRQLHCLGHTVTFAEPDAYGRQQKRDDEDFSYVESLVYRRQDEIPDLLKRAADCDLVIKHSGVGVFDALLEEKVLECASPHTRVAFWDVDAPATLARVEADPGDGFRSLVPEYDFIFTYGGGPPVIADYMRLGSANCYPIYNALDPDFHYPVAADPSLECDLVLVANRLPDREQRIENFFLRAAALAPEMRFILGGEGWSGKPIPANVRWIGHVRTLDHNRVNCSARMVLNLNRDSMAHVGFSPPTRIFEAAGAGACVITDRWPGIDCFFAPDTEILVASCAEEIVDYLRSCLPDQSREKGRRMRERALHDHTYALRAAQFQFLVGQAMQPERTGVELLAES